MDPLTPTEQQLLARIETDLHELQGLVRMLKVLRFFVRARTRSLPEIQEKLALLENAKVSPPTGQC